MEQEAPELERVKRVIRKLLNVTSENGATEAEAMLAGERAGEMLKQHDLRLTDVLIAEEVCVQAEVYADDNTAYGIIGGIARLCSLRHYHKTGSTPPTYVIFGFQHDVEIAKYLWEVCVNALDDEWARYSREHKTFARKARDSFRLGFGARISQRLTEIRAQRDREAAERAKASNSRDLVVVRDAVVEEEFQKTGVRLVSGGSRTIHDRSAYGHGAAAGARVGLHDALKGGGTAAIR